MKALTWWKNLVDQGYSPENAAADGNSVSFQNDKAAVHDERALDDHPAQ